MILFIFCKFRAWKSSFLNQYQPWFHKIKKIDFQSNMFEISEIIREKVIRLLGDELPYETAVVIELLNEKKDKFEIDANIYVSKQSQKSIVIGKNGDKIKSIGTAARVDLEKKLNKKVFLKLWCKVQKNWVNNPISLESFGIKLSLIHI